MSGADAVEVAGEQVEAARQSPQGRLRLAGAFYRDGDERGRFGRAELSFLRWEIARGVLGTDAHAGSPWWQAVNERLLRDKAEARLLHDGEANGAPSSHSVGLWLEFLARPSSVSWYRAHNASIVGGYFDHEPLAADELPAERVMMNVTLLRVLFTQAMVASPRLALGLLAPFGRMLGNPCGGSVRLFLDLHHSFPDRYPLTGLDTEQLVQEEGRLAHALDYGVVLPRATQLYTLAARALDEPRLTDLVHDGAPCYALPADHSVWNHDNSSHTLLRVAALLTRSRLLTR
jgi:hypothetical protein